MYSLLATTVAAIVGAVYRLRADTWDMPFWLIAPAVLAPIAAAEVVDLLSHRRSARTARAGRSRGAHARTTTPRTTTPRRTP